MQPVPVDRAGRPAVSIAQLGTEAAEQGSLLVVHDSGAGGCPAGWLHSCIDATVKHIQS